MILFETVLVSHYPFLLSLFLLPRWLSIVTVLSHTHCPSTLYSAINLSYSAYPLNKLTSLCLTTLIPCRSSTTLYVHRVENLTHLTSYREFTSATTTSLLLSELGRVFNPVHCLFNNRPTNHCLSTTFSPLCPLLIHPFFLPSCSLLKQWLSIHACSICSEWKPVECTNELTKMLSCRTQRSSTFTLNLLPPT